MKLKLLTVCVAWLLVAAFAVGCTTPEGTSESATETEIGTAFGTETETETDAVTETETETTVDTETETETETEVEQLEKGYALFYSESLQRSQFEITADSSIGVRFTVAEKYALGYEFATQML